MTTKNKPQILLTPGPLTTSVATKEAMLRDWGSRDTEFIAMTARIRARLTAMADSAATHVCVPVQGSGTFAVEAAIGTLVPRDGRVLVLVNGDYGRRIARICQYLGRAFVVLETEEDVAPAAEQVAAALETDPGLSHVAAVHCETTSGILNPIGEIAAAVGRGGQRLIVDAMSTFGAIPLDLGDTPYEAVVSSANKCLEGVPGAAFAIIEAKALAAAEGNANSLSLDLFDQWRALEGNGQWRFTPPTHVLAALDQALTEHETEGGVAGRGARYRNNCRALVAGMREMGFETFLPDALQASIIVTFHTPSDPNFNFATFYGALHDRGIVIYPGKLTRADSFRIGCIGRIDEDDIARALRAVGETLDEMGVTSRGTAG